MTPPVLNVALVGFGYVGRTFHAPLISAVDGLALHTIVSSRPEDVHTDWPDTRVVAELSTALADPAIDLVVLATPNELHAPQAHEALEAGKHVVIDKPFTVTVAEAEQVTAHAERAGRLLSVFHNRRWDSDFLTLRALIAEGALGEIVSFESHFDRFRPEIRNRWRERAGPGSGLWIDLGPHLLDQALQLFGPPIGIRLDTAIQREGAETDDFFHAVLRYDNWRAILHASALAPAHDLRYAVHGRRGSFMKNGLDAQEQALKAGRTPGDAGWGADPRPGTLTLVDGEAFGTRVVEGIPGDYRRYYAEVRDAIAGVGANPVTAAEGVAVMRLIDMGVESNRSRREVLVAR
ncbi:MAG: oxidoreductase [Gemmatimonadota bacterium]